MNVSGLYSQNIRKVHIADVNGEAIPFVSIRLSDSYGVISDSNGCFILGKNFDQDSIVYISHIAYEPVRLMINSIGDTIRLIAKQYSIDEVVCSNVNVPELLANAFKNTKYTIRNNYNSTRLFAIGDSLIFYNEKSLKLMKVDDKKIKTKTYGNIYYNVSTKEKYNNSFSFSSTLLMNPYFFYSTKNNLSKLIESSHIEKVYEEYYKLKAITDSSVITMFISRINGKLIRFEKSIPSQIQKGVQIGKTTYSYDFEISKKNTVAIKSFKYQTTLYIKDKTADTVKNYLSDILVDTIYNADTVSFKTLKELIQYKQKRKIIDIELNNYFNKNNSSKSNQKSSSSANNLWLNPFLYNETTHKQVNLYSPSRNFMAVFNTSTMNYDFYPSKYTINLYVNSVQDFNEHHNKDILNPSINILNPYGVRDFKSGIALGLINQLFMIIQK